MKSIYKVNFKKIRKGAYPYNIQCYIIFPQQVTRASSRDLLVENDELDIEFNSNNRDRHKRYGGKQWLFVLCTPIIKFYLNKLKHGSMKTVQGTVNVLQSIKAFYCIYANDMIFPCGSTSTSSFFLPQKCHANLSCSFFIFLQNCFSSAPQI